jgi:plastocyanin
MRPHLRRTKYDADHPPVSLAYADNTVARHSFLLSFGGNMRTSFFRSSVLLAGLTISIMLLAACGSTSDAGTNTTPAQSTPAPTTPTINLNVTTHLFEPFITVVDPATTGTTVTFINNDTVAHDLKSVPLADNSELSFVNVSGTISKTIPAGGSITLNLTKPGLYDLYDDTQATFDKTWKRVKTKANTAGFPHAAEAVIWVKGAIAGLPSAVKNTVIAGNDDFQLDFVAVKTGGSVTWHNYDTDKHYVSMPSTFGLNIDPAKIGDGLNLVNGTDDAPPNGGDTKLTFATPGLYYYYCTAHADFDTGLDRANPHPDASVFPIPMEGFVLVG